jgi:hypothetical protein
MVTIRWSDGVEDRLMSPWIVYARYAQTRIIGKTGHLHGKVSVHNHMNQLHLPLIVGQGSLGLTTIPVDIHPVYYPG